MRLLFTFVTSRLIHKSSLQFQRMASATAMVILAPGAEEMESVISIDVLRRCGVTVTVAGLDGNTPVTCSRDVVISPDVSLSEAATKTFDAVILPGGLGGSNALAKSPQVCDVLKTHYECGKLVAAICAAPIALLSHKIGLSKSITSYPGVKDQLTSSYQYKEERVVKDGNLITSRGPGTAFEFALAVAEYLVGSEKPQEIKKAMLV